MARGFSCVEASRNTTNTRERRCFSESILALAPGYQSAVLWEDESGYRLPLEDAGACLSPHEKNMETQDLTLKLQSAFFVWLSFHLWLPAQSCLMITRSEQRLENLAQKNQTGVYSQNGFLHSIKGIKKNYPKNHGDRFLMSWSWVSYQVVLDKCTEF